MQLVNLHKESILLEAYQWFFAKEIERNWWWLVYKVNLLHAIISTRLPIDKYKHLQILMVKLSQLWVQSIVQYKL